MIAWFLFVLLFNTPMLAGAVSQKTSGWLFQPKCKNPKGKLWSTLLDKDCGQSVCTKKGNKGVWEQCPRPATQDKLEEMERTMLSALAKLEEKIEEQCGYQTTFGLETTTPVKVAGSKLYYEENGAKYYGIPVAKGTTLTGGVVADTCDAVGMRAVCNGDTSCPNYSERCQVVDLEVFTSSCGNPMWGLAKKVCGGDTNPRNCPEMNGLFNYLKDWFGGECGVVNGIWCAQGNNFTPGNPPVYYAYCVQGYIERLDKMSEKQKNEMKKEAAENIPLATDRQTDEEDQSNFSFAGGYVAAEINKA